MTETILLSYSETMFRAALELPEDGCVQIDKPGHGGTVVLDVYASKLVKMTHPWWVSIRAILDHHDHRLVSNETVDDPDMMFGKAVHRRYEITVLE